MPTQQKGLVEDLFLIPIINNASIVRFESNLR